MSTVVIGRCPLCEAGEGEYHENLCPAKTYGLATVEGRIKAGGCAGCGHDKAAEHAPDCPVRHGVCFHCGVLPGIVHRPACIRNNRPFNTPLMDAMRNGTLDPKTIEIAIPPEVARYSEDIRRFVDAMIYKLSVKVHKGRWENMPIEQAMELLRGEEKELTEAIERGNLVEILLEAADVGNFALIVSAIAIERGK